MIGKVGQGGAPVMSAPAAQAPQEERVSSGMDFASRGVEVDTSVRRGLDGSASPTEPKFGDVWKNIQAQFGEKAEKPREVKKTLGKDDFLRLMIMQMKYQDPSKPFEMEKMGAEMAQLSSMEQLQNLNQTMKQLVNRDQPLERMAMTGMIGKLVTVDRERFPHAEGEKNVLKYNMPADAAKATITIVDQAGTPILEQELGPQKKGEGTFTWDGKKANLLAAKAGNYAYRIRAFNGQDQELKIASGGTARVVGVSFDGTKPVLLVGDPMNPEKAFMENISRIVDDGGLASASAMIPGARSLAGAVGSQQSQSGQAAGVPAAALAAPSTGSNFFAFKKGEGSRPLDMNSLSDQDAQAINGYAKNIAAAQAAAMDSEEKGFANGLNSAE